ncbi:unnamed protein product [Caenorhabditis angaria]|uniref:Uncharacterized protein n=1 Tax=Caenorhabditis angaria TaxID=860376 RepID=A0A9P1N4E5_9PELO|nr:unnamed protein product [Caenorhabditis angaria]
MSQEAKLYEITDGLNSLSNKLDQVNKKYDQILIIDTIFMGALIMIVFFTLLNLILLICTCSSSDEKEKEEKKKQEASQTQESQKSQASKSPMTIFIEPACSKPNVSVNTQVLLRESTLMKGKSAAKKKNEKISDSDLKTARSDSEKIPENGNSLKESSKKSIEVYVPVLTIKDDIKN